MEAFLKRGYNVVVNSRQITKANPFVDAAVSKFGRIDVLINKAGIFILKPFTEHTTADFDALVSTTLAGFLYVSQLAVKQVVQQKSGSILQCLNEPG